MSLVFGGWSLLFDDFIRESGVEALGHRHFRFIGSLEGNSRSRQVVFFLYLARCWVLWHLEVYCLSERFSSWVYFGRIPGVEAIDLWELNCDGSFPTIAAAGIAAAAAAAIATAIKVIAIVAIERFVVESSSNGLLWEQHWLMQQQLLLTRLLLLFGHLSSYCFFLHYRVEVATCTTADDDDDDDDILDCSWSGCLVDSKCHIEDQCCCSIQCSLSSSKPIHLHSYFERRPT